MLCKYNMICENNNVIPKIFIFSILLSVSIVRFLCHDNVNMAALARASRIGRIIPGNTCLLLCDLQEKFRSSIQYFPQIVEVSSRLLNAFKVLELPIIVTEQYPKGRFSRTMVF